LKKELSKTTSEYNARRIRNLISKSYLDSQELAEELEKSDT